MHLPIFLRELNVTKGESGNKFCVCDSGWLRVIVRFTRQIFLGAKSLCHRYNTYNFFFIPALATCFFLSRSITARRTVMSSQISVASAPVASAVAASGPVTSSGTPSVVNSQSGGAPPVPIQTVGAGIGKNVMNRGKGGKLGGKSLGGKALRHAGMNNKEIVGYSRPRQRRVARRAGVKMVCKDVFEVNDEMIEDFAMEFMKNALCYALHARRKTLIRIDALAAFKRMGRTVYSTSNDN